MKTRALPFILLASALLGSVILSASCSTQSTKKNKQSTTAKQSETLVDTVFKKGTTATFDDMSIITAPADIAPNAIASPADAVVPEQSLVPAPVDVADALPVGPLPPVIDPFFEAGDDDDHHKEREEVETVLFKDEFNTSFNVGTGSEKWNYFSFPPFVGNDGIETIQNGILTVESSGTNLGTEEPAFTLTVPQETMVGDLPGLLDHVKWLVYTNHLNDDTSIPGYKAVNGKELVCETWIRGRTFGTSGHPFGGNVSGDNDPRLATFTFNSVDLETFMVFDFFLTNDKIYAIYERLPFGKGGPLGNYEAFTFMKEVGTRTINNFHHLEIAYNREKGTVRWLLDDQEVFKVSAIGKLIDVQLRTLNHGGDEPAAPLVLNQLNCGLGHFTLLDAFLPSQVALVKLSTAPNFYFHPVNDGALSFFDSLSLSGSRLFGQGARTEVKKFQVKYVEFE